MSEEYIPEIKYNKDPDNDAADEFCRLLLIHSDIEECNITLDHLAYRYCVKELYSNPYTLTYQTIDKYQRKEKNPVETLKHANYHTKFFRGCENIICSSIK